MRSLYLLSLVCLALLGCATPVQRDAQGNPLLQRLDPETLASQPVPQKLGVQEIAALARQGSSSAEIIGRMRATGSRLEMNTAQQQALRERGVDEATIRALIDAEQEAKRTDRLTAEADQAAVQRAQARRQMYRSRYYDYYDPWWGRPYPYLGYGWYGHRRGWHSGFGWSW